MAVDKTLARGWNFEVRHADGIQWVEIKGINSFSMAGSKEDTDTTDFDSQGRTEHLVAARSANMTLEGFYLIDESNGTRDPGQARVEVLADNIGTASIAEYRFTGPSGAITVFRASVEVEGPGGGNNDAASWQARLMMAGDYLA